MNTSHQQALAEQFHRLHDAMLVLPNAWDPPSARMVERAGAAAVATTSAGVAWSRAVADGGGLDRGTALDAANRVVSSVAVPVTVDIEDGYPDEPGGIEATIDAVIDCGAVGVNIEDSHAGRLVTAAEHADVLRRVMARVDAAPVRLFVNARIDSFLLGGGSGSTPRMLLATQSNARMPTWPRECTGSSSQGCRIPTSSKHWRPRSRRRSTSWWVPARPPSPN